MIKIFLFLFSFNLLAQEADLAPNTFDYTRDIYKKVDGLKDLKPEEYTDKLYEFRKEIDRYIKHKKGVCGGNFSTVILNEKEQDENEYKLSKREQELCYRELKGLQLNYINKLFVAKKRYLNYLHKLRIENLNAVRDKSLKQLQATFDKKSVPKNSIKPKRKITKKTKSNP